MILRKPYAFFIKIFKPIHIFLAVLVIALIYKTNKILSFFNHYIYSSENIVGQTIKENLATYELFVIPIVLIIFSMIFLGIMFNKKKPITFYVINIFVFLVIVIINLYCSNFLGIMETSIISIKLIKLNHDLILINMAIEVIVFIGLIIRGLGINFKKFNFDSDVTKLNISDSDKEEFELSINVDLDAVKRKRKRNFRYFKYTYLENKMLINVFIFLCIVIITSVSIYIVASKEKINMEGVVYNINNFNMIVNNTKLLKENFSGKKITDNYLVVVDYSLQSNFTGISLFLKDFSLEIGEARFQVETKYEEELSDLGNIYSNNILSEEYDNYLLVFEIPEKYIKSDMCLVFNNEGKKVRIKLNPKSLENAEFINVKSIGEEISFEESLGNISFVINSFEIRESFLINYNYCINDNDCILSKEYIKPSINQNFDKVVLKLNVDYIDESRLEIKKFYNFFNSFGIISYKIGDTWFSQNSNFEELRGKKVDNKNNVYIGINSNIINSESIKLVFNIRNSKYEYILK